MTVDEIRMHMDGQTSECIRVHLSQMKSKGQILYVPPVAGKYIAALPDDED